MKPPRARALFHLHLLLLSAALVTSATDPAADQPPRPARPNILILFADDLGYGDLASYGHPTTSTPHLDALANEGVRFTSWYSGFHVCSPSRAAMMTGRLPIRMGLAGAAWTGGVFNADAVGGLPKNETTIAAALKRAGYASMAVGKWHLGQRPEFLPTSHGFDEYYGIPYSVDMGPSAWRTATGDRDRPFLPLIHSTAPGHVDVLEQPTDLNTLSDKYVGQSAGFIARATAAQTPWLLYMAFNHVHVPDFVSPEFCNTTRRGVYGDALRELDDAVGQILAAVDDAGATTSTVVFFTSDNGPWLRYGQAGGSAGPLRDGKTTTWEGGVRVPGIVRWKGRVANPGRVERGIVATYDIYATALSLAGVDAGAVNGDRIVDGVDLSPLLFGGGGGGKGGDLHACIFHYKGTPGTACPADRPDCPGLWAVRCGAYKMHYVTTNWTNESVQTFHDPPLMFHVDHDPGESFPLDPAGLVYKRARARIEAEVADHKRGIRAVPNQMGLGKDPKFAICCGGRGGWGGDWGGGSGGRSEGGGCNCNPENMRVFVCDGSDQFDDGGVGGSERVL